ncbi:MAG: HAD family hydrolase [Deltaproteobacteria bacterium]
MPSKKAVFLDFGDTLASTDPPYIFRIAMAMREAGLDISDREFEIEFLKADYELYLKHKSMGGISPEKYREWFFPIIYNSLLPPDGIEKFRQRVRSAMSEIEFTRAALPGVPEILDDLRGRGYRLAVISNNDGRTEEKCEEVGIREYFDHVFDSTNLGLVKPDPGIFKFALEKFGISPEEAVHVGDMYGTDVLGGTDAGLDVIWFNQRKIERLNENEATEVADLAEIINLID